MTEMESMPGGRLMNRRSERMAGHAAPGDYDGIPHRLYAIETGVPLPLRYEKCYF